MRRRKSLQKETQKKNLSNFQNIVENGNVKENRYKPFRASLISSTVSAPSKYPSNFKAVLENSVSRFGYLNGSTTKAKISNVNLKTMANDVVFSPSSIMESFVPAVPVKYEVKPSSKAKSVQSNYSKKIIAFAICIALLVCLWAITTASEFLVINSFKDKKHNHKKRTNDVHIKFPSKSTPKSVRQNEANKMKDKTSQINLRATSSNDELNVHGGMARPNSRKSEDYLIRSGRSDLATSEMKLKEENYDKIMPMNVPTDFLFATSSMSSKMGGYGQLPFPIYCPIVPTKHSNQAIEYIETCEYEHIAWSASLWIYPSQLGDQNEIVANKRIIFSNSVLELYLNNHSQLILEYMLPSSKLKLSTQIRVEANEWSHIGVSVVPVDGNANKIKVRLYIHGKEFASGEIVTDKVTKSGLIDTSRLGQDELNDNSFEGYLAMLAIWTKTGVNAIFRDDLIMKSAYRVGLDTNDLAYLEQRGLVKSPNFLFTLRIPPLDTFETGM